MATFERGVSPTASMREKSLLKRRVNKEHNSNFRAGYVNVNEEHLHKTGIRGRKRYIVCFVTVILALTVIVNLLITVSILGVLGIGRDGMDALEFIPSGKLLRFLGKSDMNEVYITDPVIGSLPNGAIELTAENGGSVELKVQRENGPQLRVSGDKTVLESAEGLDVFDPSTGETVFTADPTRQNLAERLTSIEHVEVQQLVTDRVTSEGQDSLEVKGSGRAILFGAQGIQLTGKEARLSTKGDLNIWSATSDVVLDGAAGIRLSFRDDLPVKPLNATAREDVVTYKLCVREEDGSLYSVAWNSSCHQPSATSDQ